MGSTNRVLEYIGTISLILHGEKLPNHPNFDTSKFPSCERNGVDQGIHNVILGLLNIDVLTT